MRKRPSRGKIRAYKPGCNIWRANPHPNDKKRQKGVFSTDNGKREICRECAYAKHNFGGSCYCIKYGYIIGYSKQECRGYEHGQQVREQKNNG